MKFKDIFTLKSNIEDNASSINEVKTNVSNNSKEIVEVKRVNELQNEALETANSSINANNTSVSNLTTKVTTIETDLSELSDTVSNLTTKVTTIETDLSELSDTVSNSNSNPYKGKKWTALGDSLTMTTSSNSIKHTPNGRNYTYWVKEKLGIGTLVNMGLDSSTISTVRTSPQNFIQRMVNIPLDSDIITVFGGYNDMWSSSSKLGTIEDTDTNTIYGALNKIARYLLCTYPKATIVFFTMLHWTWEREGSSANPPYVVNPNGLTTPLLNQAIRDIGNKYSIPVIDLEKNSGIFPGTFNQKTGVATKYPHFSYYTYDGLHLNERGHQKISNVIVSELLKLNVGYVVEDTTVATISDPSETGTATAIAWATKYTEKASSSSGSGGSSSGGSSSGGTSTDKVQVPLNVASANFSFANDNSSTVSNWTAGYAGTYTKSLNDLGITISTDASVIGDFVLKGTGVEGIEKVSSATLSSNSSGETEVVAVQADTTGNGNFFIAFRLSHTRLGIDDNETDSTVKGTKMKEFIASCDWYLEFTKAGTTETPEQPTDPEEPETPSNYIDVSVSEGSSLFTYSNDNRSSVTNWTIGCACPYPKSQSSLGITIDTSASVVGDFTLVGTNVEGITVTSSTTLGANNSGEGELVAVQGTSNDSFYLAFRLSHTRLGIDDSETDTAVMLESFKTYLASCDWVLRFNA